ncbi:alpha/beta fold hydrolase [Clostridium magnum]|uniref:Haloacetate dehalogenase H-1 n=1 Tax=Clostridium magnum DSM 2767 TaxID=1121326 RepID=A0A162S1E9_9CLOT|nr:alpha/beta hydrolase [Clostridium magnum]KZL90651.1 haloacetate dehalogenase H-1 [Clostridium magnum DSM 2767]SHI38557.1 haloacetate dehalogenase [Clostridium magnum DSM 2767]
MAHLNYFQGFKHLEVDTGEVTIQTWVGGHGKEVILLLHGHPESHLMWHGVAPKLAENYTVVVTDMRGYGDSSKPEGLPDHSTYSKRTMAKDQVIVMEKLGYTRFHIAGHDRGGRVCHRMILDYSEKIKSCTLLDIIPTIDVYSRTDQMIATKYWHWFFYIQPSPFPENFLGSQPEYFIRSNILKKTIPGSLKEDTFPEDVVQEYIRHYSDPATVHAIAEDYRASVTIDWEHDLPDRKHKMETPLLCIWGSDGNICKIWDVVDIWSNLATNVKGCGVPGCGHFVPEEKPEIVVEEISKHIERNK